MIVTKKPLTLLKAAMPVNEDELTIKYNQQSSFCNQRHHTNELPYDIRSNDQSRSRKRTTESR